MTPATTEHCGHFASLEKPQTITELINEIV
jgi:hypothetical protein